MAIKRGSVECHVPGCLCSGCDPKQAGEAAPLRVVVEAWPAQARARASLTENGKTRDVEVSSLVLSMILAAVRNAR